MEPLNIDKIIREKLQESNDLHKHQMDSAKPFVWSAVQQKITAKGTITWYHLAAAVVLLMIIFSFVLYSVQQQYRQQTDLLAKKLDQVQQSYVSQTKALHTKDIQAELLATKLGQIEQMLASLQTEQPSVSKEVIIYRTDTVYVKQVKYVAIATDSTHSEKLVVDGSEDSLEKEATISLGTKTDEVIFLSSSKQSRNQPSESIKLKFGPFSRED